MASCTPFHLNFINHIFEPVDIKVTMIVIPKDSEAELSMPLLQRLAGPKGHWVLIFNKIICSKLFIPGSITTSKMSTSLLGQKPYFILHPAPVDTTLQKATKDVPIGSPDVTDTHVVNVQQSHNEMVNNHQADPHRNLLPPATVAIIGIY